MSDREFLKLFSGLIGALVALTVVLFIIANMVGGDGARQGGPDTEAIAERIEPIGQVAIGEPPPLASGGVIASANAAPPDKGKAVFDSSCAACHATGVAGAPRIGDKAAWKERVAKGMPTLDEHAIKGFQGKAGFMPPKGGNMNLSDADVKAAVEFMVKQSQ